MPGNRKSRRLQDYDYTKPGAYDQQTLIGHFGLGFYSFEINAQVSGVDCLAKSDLGRIFLSGTRCVGWIAVLVDCADPRSTR